VALVIGDGAYATAPLANTLRDADTVASALTSVGFAVTLRKDLTQVQMKQALVDFGHQLEAGGVGMFYYSGHGVEYDGANYLVPVDAALRQPDDLEVYGVDVDGVLGKMAGAGNRVNIVVLEASRNDPFAKGGAGGLGVTDARGTFMAYATTPGRVATDEGVYARALAEELHRPGATIEAVFKAVGGRVEDGTGGRQSPWTAGNLRGEFYFVLPEEGVVPDPGPAPVHGPSPAGAPKSRTAIGSMRVRRSDNLGFRVAR